MIGRHMWLTLAVVIALEIGDVTRFPTAAKLASCVDDHQEVRNSRRPPGRRFAARCEPR
jgi:hypothetical protein